jgi:hypothetical protein
VAVDDVLKAKVLTAVREFTNFNADNDPHGEHDCATFGVDGQTYIFKVDCYDLKMEFGSEDPSDPRVTAVLWRKRPGAFCWQHTTFRRLAPGWRFKGSRGPTSVAHAGSLIRMRCGASSAGELSHGRNPHRHHLPPKPTKYAPRSELMNRSSRRRALTWRT